MNREQRRASAAAPLENAELLKLRDWSRERQQMIGLVLIPFDQPRPPSYVVAGKELETALREAVYWHGVTASMAERLVSLTGEPRRRSANMLSQALHAARSLEAKAFASMRQMEGLAGDVMGSA